MKIKCANDFFKRGIAENIADTYAEAAPVMPAEAGPNQAPRPADNALRRALNEAARALKECGLSTFADDMRALTEASAGERFTVAVVGEFSKGKSTLINNLLGKAVLPVADLPTTAMLTRIRYRKNETLIQFDENGRKLRALELRPASWSALTVNNAGGESPTGACLAGVDSAWLEQNNIEIIDTPGAGDLDERRARQIGDALMSSDGAVIVISATAALSLSEKLFMEQRLISRGTPFVMLALTKLDQIPIAERNSVIAYVIDKLNMWSFSIPVFIPNAMELSDDTYSGIMGIDAVRAHITGWLTDPRRTYITQKWLASRAATVLSDAVSALGERREIFAADAAKRDEILRGKRDALERAGGAWEDLRIQLLKRANECFNEFEAKTRAYTDTIAERLMYEAGHAGNPQKWLKEDYPYRLKTELANLSTQLDGLVTRIISEDIRWLNQALDERFKSRVQPERPSIADRDEYGESGRLSSPDIQAQNLNKMQNIARIGTTALSIAGAIALGLSGMGHLSLIATMGLGTGGGILSNLIFSRKLEEQREKLKRAIAEDVPRVVAEATEKSEEKLLKVYDAIILEAKTAEAKWRGEQRALIESANRPEGERDAKDIEKQMRKLDEIRADIDKYARADERKETV